MKVVHNAEVIVGDYPFADQIKSEVLSLLKVCNPIPQNHSNVKASVHTEWDWEPDNLKFRNLKAYIKEQIEKIYRPGSMSDGSRSYLKYENFWANVYKKGDYAQSHSHKPSAFSFAYFVKSKWYYPPLVFTDSGKGYVQKREGLLLFHPI